MFDPKCYRKACDRLTLDAEKIEEMIIMTENKGNKHVGRPARMALLAAALATALCVSAAAAELPAVKEFFATVFVTVKSDSSLVTGLAVPTMAVDRRDGRTVLILDEEEIDVTDALAKDGSYLYEGEGYDIQVHADGTALLTARDAEGNEVFSFTTKPGMADDKAVYNVTAAGEDESETGVYNIVTDESGCMEIVDDTGKTHTYSWQDGELMPQK